MTRLATCLVAILSLLMISPALLGQPVGEVSVPVCAAPPRLDADLNDPCWAAATKLTGFRAIATSKSAEVQTTAWLCRDDTWLYIAFRCHEPSAISIKRTVNDRDAAVSSDDSVEIFLDPGTGGKEYVHLALNVNGAQADQLCRGEERLRSWNMPWRSAAKLDAHLDSATGWSAELAIPLALVPGRQPNALWRINLCRNRRAVSPAEHSSLAPLPPGASFHAPQHFLPVKLSGLKLQVPFGPMVRSATAKPFTIKDGAYSYAIEVVVRNLTGSAGEVDVVAQDLPRTGQGRQVAEKLALGPSEEKQVTFRIQAAHAGPRDAWVGLREPGSELWLQKTHVAGMEELSRLDAYLDRSYYTTEKQARVYAEMRTDREDRVAQGLVLDVKLTGPAKEPLAAGSTPCSDDVVAINLDISRVPNGAHTVEAVLRNKGGVELGSVQLPLIKRPPAPDGANEVKIDRYNRCLLLNGKPFFPLGAVGAHYHGRFADWKADYFDAQFKFCREAGLNCVIDWVGYRPADTPLEDTRKCYDLAHQHGLKVIGRPYGSGRDLRYSSPKFRDAAAEMIAAMDPYLAMCLRHPAVVAFYHLDEPQPGLSIDDTLQAFTDKVHSLAPYHPVYVSLTRYIHESQRRWFGTITDLLGAHNYWYVLRADGLQAMSGYWRALDTHARNAHSPTMALPQLDYWGPGYQNCDFMLPAEQRAQTYLALVHGARSVIYFVLPFRHQLSVATQKQLSAEVARLAPALLSREPRQEVTFEPESASTVFPLGNLGIRGQAQDPRFPLVQVSLRSHPTEGQVLLAVNPNRQAVHARLRVSSLSADSAVRSLFDDKQTYTVKDDAFSDTFEPMATRAYLLTRTQPTTGTVRIHLTLSGPAVDSPADLTPKTGEPKKNLVSNSSFEQSRMPGHPMRWEARTWTWLIPDTRANGLEESNPFHGRYCYRITKPNPDECRALHEPVTLRQDGPHTLSVYLRADKPGSKAMVYLKPPYDNVTVGTSWQRFSITRELSRKDRVLVGVYHLGQAGLGNLYVDAIQLEEGSKATEYEPY